MINIKNRYLIAIATIITIAAVMIGVPALLMFIDAACSPISNTICAEWRNFQWETVLAGIFGLSGGLFVIASSRQQINANREETEKILTQSKLHRADDLNAPLQLSRDAVDDCWNWLNNTMDHLHGLQEQVETGPADIHIQQLNEACGRAHTNLTRRVDHIKSICNEHKTTVLSYNVYSQLELVANVMDLRFNDPDDAPQGYRYEQYRRTRELFRIARTKSAAARTAIDRQISENLVRCGVED